MSRLLPSMSSLKAFEASARHLSFSKAAEELRLTQSAVSRQIKTLEDALGVKLFYRVRRRILLSEAATAYATDIRTCLSQIEEATQELLASRGTGGVLNLAILPVFGTKWLIPRMPAFWQAHPGISVNLLRPPMPFDFISERFDAAILFGGGSWPGGVVAHRLMPEQFVVVCAPALVTEPGLATIADLSRHTLLQHTTLPHAWQDWLIAAGSPEINGLKGPRFERFSLVLAAAIAAKGVALLPRFMVEEAVASGRLVIRFDISLPDSYAYYLVYPEEKREMPALRAFRDWLLTETQSTVCEASEVVGATSPAQEFRTDGSIASDHR